MPKVKITLSIEELLNELNRRRKKLPQLRRVAASLQKKLASVQAEIDALGGAMPARAPAASSIRAKATRTRRRPRNKGSLSEAVLAVLSKNEPKSVKAIIADVLKGGYKTTSKNFSTIVYQTLARERKRVAKAGRGLYQLKG